MYHLKLFNDFQKEINNIPVNSEFKIAIDNLFDEYGTIIDIERAYDLIMEIIVVMKKYKIKFDIIDTSDSKSDKNDKLHRSKWRSVNIEYGKDKHKIAMVRYVMDKIGKSKIYFDYGGMFTGGAMDWQIDWSLTLENRL